MGFIKLVKPDYPSRLWTLVGYPGSGKTTFATQMRAPLLAIDADNRFNEVLHLTESDVFSLSPQASDHTDPERIAALLEENMLGSDIKTIVVDSLTAIISPLVTQAIRANDAGRNRNKAAAFKDKALAMRLIQDAVTRWGRDVLWIYHLQDGRDGQGNKVTKTTLPETEQERLARSINLRLEIVQEGRKRGIKVNWARRGRRNLVLWDESGKWIGMPERIEQAVYGGLSAQEQERLEHGFPTITEALQWAVERGGFPDESEARKAYEEVRDKHKPKYAAEMAQVWIDEVLSRQG